MFTLEDLIFYSLVEKESQRDEAPVQVNSPESCMGL